MSSVSEPAPSPLVLALAEVIRSAVRNTNLVVDHAVATGVPVLVPCVCAVDIGDQRCVCGLGLPLSDPLDAGSPKPQGGPTRGRPAYRAGRALSVAPVITTWRPPTRWRSRSSGTDRWLRCGSWRLGAALRRSLWRGRAGPVPCRPRPSRCRGRQRRFGRGAEGTHQREAARGSGDRAAQLAPPRVASSRMTQRTRDELPAALAANEAADPRGREVTVPAAWRVGTRRKVERPRWKACYEAAGQYVRRHRIWRQRSCMEPTWWTLGPSRPPMRGSRSESTTVYDGVTGRFYDRTSYYETVHAIAEVRYSVREAAERIMVTKHWARGTTRARRPRVEVFVDR